MRDQSNGYEAIAGRFISGRTHGGVGATVVREWAQALPQGASILDIGCGSGVPISDVLIQDGFAVSAVDASRAMIAVFRERFPGVPAECSAVEDSVFFEATYDAVVAWGLMFLLSTQTQRNLIGKIGRALKSGGKLLFTAPEQACTWLDAMTGLPSVSLGREVYREVLLSEDLVLVGERLDEGENYYYLASKV